MMKINAKTLVILIVVYILGSMSLFKVDETDQAIILQFVLFNIE